MDSYRPTTAQQQFPPNSRPASAGAASSSAGPANAIDPLLPEFPAPPRASSIAFTGAAGPVIPDSGNPPAQIAASYRLSDPASSTYTANIPVKRDSSGGTTGAAAAAIGGGNEVDGDGKEPAKKKQKGPLSCAECRRLKLKCDRTFPCSSCVKRGVALICPQGELKGGKGKRLILADTEELHARIATLEQALAAAHHKLSIAPTSPPTSLPAAASSTSTNPLAGTQKPHPLLEGSFHYSPLPGASGEKDKEVDGGENVGSGQLTIREGGISRFFGNAGSAYLLSADEEPPSSTLSSLPPRSSNGTFSNNGAATLLHGEIAASKATSNGAGGQDEVQPWENQVTVEFLKSHLPDPREATGICDLYWKNGAWMYNVLSRANFEQDYLPSVYTSPSPDAHKLSLVFFILSLGSLFDLNKPPYNSTAKTYFSLGKAAYAVGNDKNGMGNLPFIQATHLMGTFLLNGAKQTTGGEAFWPYLGLAVKAAQAIGLHRDGEHWNLPEDECEDRRRIWWEVNSYDILQSLTLGRPRSITDFSCDTKFPQRPPPDSELFHIQKYKLMRMVARICEEQSRASPSSYETLLGLDRDIREFEKSLPPILHCSETSCVLPTDGDGLADKRLILQRHSMVLITNESLLFLHRSWFARALRDHPEEPLKSKYSHSFVANLEACKTIISIVRDLVKLQNSLASRWWFFWFHSFSACVCLAATVIRAPGSSLAHSALQELELGVMLFEESRPGSRAREGLSTLLKLRERARESILQIRAQRYNASGIVGDTALPKAEAEDRDDLDLLGAETNFHRIGSVSATPSSTTDSPMVVKAYDESPQEIPHPSFTPPSFQPPISNDDTIQGSYMDYPTSFDDAFAFASSQSFNTVDFGEAENWSIDPSFNFGSNLGGNGIPSHDATGEALFSFDFESFMNQVNNNNFS